MLIGSLVIAGCVIRFLRLLPDFVGIVCFMALRPTRGEMKLDFNI